jgi:hypothetical protein
MAFILKGDLPREYADRDGKRRIVPINARTEEVNSAITIFELSFMELRFGKRVRNLISALDARLSVTGSPVAASGSDHETQYQSNKDLQRSVS